MFFFFFFFNLLLVLGCILQCASTIACPQYCVEIEGVYMICSSSGSQKLNPTCVNCCLTPPDCKLYRGDGTLLCAART
ncbi:proteinase inhibitor psi-1.2 [Phtheirospermum japonicum]|uniref:Proteinase inhibitor psi-1.2 n=1 Tax=Phtheirospermum japonicum TaxID=374723 RepID=A0A830B8N1_9LAMI|nr:proteinase inhibitor psi-1.2 [Phtheirospermum japonicum]